MRTTTAAKVRGEISDILGRVEYLREEVVVTRHGKPIAMIIPMAEYEEYMSFCRCADTALLQEHIAKGDAARKRLPTSELKRKFNRKL